MARFLVRQLVEDDAVAWHALWQRSDGCLGLHWDWVELAARGVGSPVRLGVFAGEGNLVAGACFVSRRRRWTDCWVNPAPAGFTGVLQEFGAGGESFLRDVQADLSASIRGKVAAADIVLPGNPPDGRGLTWDGWSAQPHYTYVNEIVAEDTLEKGAENQARRAAGKARAAGFVVVQGPELLDEVLSLWEETRSRKGLGAWVSDECHRGMGLWKAEGVGCRIMGVRDSQGGALHAAAIYGYDRSRVYYLLGASRIGDEEKGGGAPSLLHCEASASFFRERGAYLYDWVGANTASVVQFKKRFRPRLSLNLLVSWRSRAARGLGV